MNKNTDLIKSLYEVLTRTICETNGLSINDTLKLLACSPELHDDALAEKSVHEFINLLATYQVSEINIETILKHPLSEALFLFFKRFPIPFYEEHIHLTGSLTAEFIYPRLKKLLKGKNAKVYEEKIKEAYGENAIPINSVEDVDNLIRLKDNEHFERYLKILYLPKLILNSRKAHEEASYHMASELYNKYNVGNIKLKFTLSRSSAIKDEQIPGLENITEEDVVLGLYDGFKKFQKEIPGFNFSLSPSFRKEHNFFDTHSYKTKKDHFQAQIESLLLLTKKFPFLEKHLNEIDTVGDERELYRKSHFEEFKIGLRRLQYHGFFIRSHHGETWKTLRRGIQSVDNAMNIWHIDTLEHGLSLGVNPNFYFHSLFNRIVQMNKEGKKVPKGSLEYLEISDMEWDNLKIPEKLNKGLVLTSKELKKFTKIKYHTSREVEYYQHDVLNRMINKGVSLVALPSSNMKLTSCFPDYKDHPFSWWEKKGVKLGVGTDNYITLDTNYIQELMILLYSDPENLKITKLLMLSTKEERRPYLGHLLWEMRKALEPS